MRSSVAVRVPKTASKRRAVRKPLTNLMPLFLAAVLAVGLLPMQALAAPSSLTLIPEGDEGAVRIVSSAEEGSETFSHCLSDDASFADADGAASLSEDDEDNNDAGTSSALSADALAEDGLTPQKGEADPAVSLPVPDVINEQVALEPIARAESTRSFFLASTMEDIKSVSMVSAKLSLDEDEPVVGSFVQDGMAYAIEPGGGSVALVAVDYDKLPEETIEKQVLVIPSTVILDDADAYSVTRIADGAFSTLTKEISDTGHTGAKGLFSDEALLAEAGVDPEDVASYLSDEEHMVDIDGDGEADTIENPLRGCSGILALGIPASVASIEDDAFSGSDTLQYLVISEDNQTFASFDGALYDKELTSLRFIPEGRSGAVRIAASATDIESEALSRCPVVDAIIADLDSAAYEIVVRILESSSRPDMEAKLLTASTETTALVHHDLPNLITELDYSRLELEERSSSGIPSNYSLIYQLNSPLTLTNYDRWFTPGGCDANNSTGNYHQSDPSTYSWTKPAGTRFWDCPSGYGIVFSDDVNRSYRSKSGSGGILTTAANLASACRASTVTFEVDWYATADTTGVPESGQRLSTVHLPEPKRTGYRFDGWYTYEYYPYAERNKEGRYLAGQSLILAADADFTAYWQVIPYSISYALNGGSVSGNPASYNVATASFTLKNPTKTGYTFTGWSGTGLSGSANKTVTVAKGSTGNRSYTANWSKNNYVVSWDRNGGSGAAIANDSVPYGNSFTVNRNPGTKVGHTFAGWVASGGITGTYQNGSSFTMPAASVKLTANWTKNSYSVSWDTNGGSVASIAGSSVPYGNTFWIDQSPGTKYGYDFSGWSASGSISGTYQNGSSLTMPAGTVTLTAVWTPHVHGVAFDAAGGSGGDDDIASQTFGTPVAMRDPGTKAGYDFQGWKCSTDGKTYPYPGSFTMGDTDVTFTAQWSLTPYTIFIHPGEQAQAGSSVVEVPYDITCEVILADSVSWKANPGYRLSGFVEADSSGNATGGDRVEKVSVGSTGDKRFAAVWEKVTYSLRLDGLEGADFTDGSSGWIAAERTFQLGDGDIAFPSEEWVQAHAPRRGYGFLGWSSTGSEEGMATSFSPDAHIRTSPDATEVTYRAVWRAIPYTILFDPGYGTEEDMTIIAASYESGAFTAPSAVGDAGSGIFSHWGIADDDASNCWRSNTELTVRAILEEGGYPEDRIEASEQISGATYHNVIRLHAVWIAPVSVEAPLTVNLALDPETGMTVAAEGYIRSSYGNAVQVESVTYAKTASSELGGGTDEVLGDIADEVSLSIRAIRSDATSSGDDPFADATPYRLSLGQKTTVSKGQLGSVFPIFGDSGARLRLSYDLAFIEGLDLSKLNLPEQDTLGPNHWSSQSYPIARLHYTLSVA